MATFVLVHGAFAGGWQMRAGATQLRIASQEVFTPTLTGLGERSHLALPETDLATHVQDVVSLIHIPKAWCTRGLRGRRPRGRKLRAGAIASFRPTTMPSG